MKTFVIINGVVGFTLLSSCSTRPVNDLSNEPLDDIVQLFQAKNEAHPWKSSPVETFHSYINIQKESPPSLEKLMVDRKEVEESLRGLRNNRVSGVDDNSGVNSPARADHGRIPSTDSGQVAKAVKKTVRGINKEIEAYKALAGGRVSKANGLLREATDDQKEAFSLINNDKTTLLLGLLNDQNVQKQVRKLTEQIEAYELLPTERELLAVFHSLDKDFPSTMFLTIPVTNPQKTTGFLSPWVRSLDKSRIRTGLSFLATALKGNELQVLKLLRHGDRAGALEKIKSMQRTRKIALRAYEDYQDMGYGTINFETRGSGFYKLFQDQLVRYSASMKTDGEITSQRIAEIKQRLKLHKGPKP